MELYGCQVTIMELFMVGKSPLWNFIGFVSLPLWNFLWFLSLPLWNFLWLGSLPLWNVQLSFGANQKTIFMQDCFFSNLNLPFVFSIGEQK